MIISFGELNKRWLLFIFIPLLITLRWLFENWFKNENKNLFFNGFLRMLARVLNIIPWIFLEKSMSFKKIKDKKEMKDKKDKKELEKDLLREEYQMTAKVKKVKAVKVVKTAKIVEKVSHFQFNLKLKKKKKWKNKIK